MGNSPSSPLCPFSTSPNLPFFFPHFQPMFFQILLFPLILPSSLVLAYELSSVLDNYIIGTPKVVCEETEVALDILTAKPFIGNIFVKGRAKDASCRQSFGNPAKNETSIYSLSLGKCGMQRLRSANPRGISFAVTVVVSFHPAGFITRNDRAYHLSCFYTEPEEIVTSSFEVSHLPAQELSDHMSLPSCRYSVHSGTLDGPQLSWANVGDTVYHVWECKGPELGILVKKCFVTDGDGEDHAVVDENGCSLDLGLLSEIVYNTDDGKMWAYAKSQVFKYADSNQLFFTCQIRMCQKQMDLCRGITPPKCGGGKKGGGGGKSGKKEHHKGGKHHEKLDKLLEDLEVEVEGADWSLDEISKEERKKEMKTEKEEEEEVKKKEKEGNGELLEEKGKGEEVENGNGKKEEEGKNGRKNKGKKGEEEEENEEGNIEAKEWKKGKAEGNGTMTGALGGKLANNGTAELGGGIAEKEEEEEGDEADGKAETVVKGRGRRALLHQIPSSSADEAAANQMEIDVASPQMLVLDREDQERIGTKTLLLKPLKKADIKEEGINPIRKEIEAEQRICLAKGQLMAAMALVLAILTGFGSLLALLVGRILVKLVRRRRQGNHHGQCQLKRGWPSGF